MEKTIGIIVFTLFAINSVTAECGYSLCHKTDPKKLNIHLIPHSHDDVGWLRTVDNYYINEVRNIITNVVKSLQLSPKRKFTQVESYFFHRWWTEQNEATKIVVRKLVTDGQLVFTNGGWTVNDEGAAHYNNIIDQMTLGLKFLDQEFGKCGHPKVSWQIDPFGASKEMASLFAQMGVDGHVLNRGPHPKGEYIWKGSPDLNTQIFTTVLHDHYGPPNGFDFENGNDITDANKEIKAKQFIDIVKNWNKDTNYNNTNQVLVTMGQDFKYQHSERWFSNMDKLIKEITETHKDIDIFYSTPNCYIQEVNRLNKTFGVRDVDYLNYWVGYYSNRPTLKREDRVGNNYLQASKQLDVLSRLNPSTTKAYLDESRNELAIMTHHDAITGTSPQETVDDYGARLYSSIISSRAVLQKAYKQLLAKTDSTEQIFCTNLNITECSITETNDKIAVTLYNPIARPVSQYIRLPVGSGNYQVFDNKGVKVLNTVLVPVSKSVSAIPERKSKSTQELVFRAQLPTLGFATYFVRKTAALKKRSTIDNMRKKRAAIELKGKSFSLQIDEQTGALKSMTTNGKTHSLRQSFKWYKAMAGVKNKEDSGSYHFCPDGTAHDFGAPKLVSKFSSGSNHEIHQQFSDFVSQTVRTYDDEDYIEFDWTVGPIPIADAVGKEIITRFESDLKNGNKFLTDANGRQMVERTYDPKQVGCTGVDSPITGNWYPIYSKAFIRDIKQGIQMSVLNDRTQGGSSLTEGTIELMVHRRLTKDGAGGPFKVDEKGVDGKGIVIRGKHYLFIKPINESAKYVHDLSQRLLLEPIISFAKYESTESDYISKHLTSFSGLNKALPENLHLLTLENWKKNQILLRLENVYQNSDNSPLAKAVDFDIKDLFKTFKISNIVETTLTANELLSESKRLQWHSKEFLSSGLKRSERAVDSNIHLSPQQIRTFILTVEDNVLPLVKCSAKWVNSSVNKIPKEGLIGGFDYDKTPFYVCRHLTSGDLIVGKADANIGCHLDISGKEIEVKSEGFEILIANNVEWVPRHGTDPLPSNALLSGHKADGQPIYIGRCALHDSRGDSVVIGKVDYYFYYPLSGIENMDCSNHEILVCN